MISQHTAITIACNINQRLSKLGLFVGLTGGCLYKEGLRKDLDLIIYGRNGDNVDPKVYTSEVRHEAEQLLMDAGYKAFYTNSWLTKVRYKLPAHDDILIDLFWMDRINLEDNEIYSQDAGMINSIKTLQEKITEEKTGK